MTELQHFIESKTPESTSYVVWQAQGFDFDVASYLSIEVPPKELITSIRGVVRYGDRVVVLENEDTRHFLPGGRLENDETFTECLVREVREECGLTVQTHERLGFIHYHHRQPEPKAYGYPYPDMFHLVYSVVASGSLVQTDEDGYEFASYLFSPEDALRLPNTEAGHPFLKQAMAL